jgi:O-antigen/teichoic acid export membrane protein
LTTIPSPAGPDEGLPPEALQVTGLGRNAAWLYLNAATSALGGLYLLGFSFRHLGASSYGLYALAATVLGVFGTVDFGLRMFVVRATARDSGSFTDDERHRVRSDVEAAHTTYAVWGLAVLAATGILTLGVVLSHDHSLAGKHMPLVVLLVGLSVALNLGTASFAGIPAGRRQFHVPAIGGIAGTCVEIAVVVPTIDYLHLVALGAGFLASVLVSQGYCAWWLRRHEPWFRHLPRRIGWADVRRVASFSAPLLVLSVAGQVISATDLMVVGAVATAAAVGLYRAGSIVPSQATFLLFTGYDTVYPHLAGTTDRDGQENATRFLTRVASFVAGAVFATVIVLRVDVLMVVTGHASALGESVLVVFCCVWLANVPIHGLSLLLIARGRQNVFVWLVGVEASANLALTIVFAVVIGPIGAAYATLVTIVASNLIVFPHLVRHEFSEGAARRTVLKALAAIAAGGASAALAASPALELGADWSRLLVGLALGGGFSCTLGLVLLRRRGRSILASMLRDTRAA